MVNYMLISQIKKELKILHQFAQKISSSLELNDVLNHIVEIAIDLTKGDSCLIYLYNRKSEELVLRTSKNPHPRILGRIKLKIGEGITGLVAKQKKPIVISEEAYKDPHFKSFTNLPEDKYEAFLSLPILSKNELVGVMNIQHKDKHTYPEWQVNLLFTIAKYLGSVIENAIIYDEVQKKVKQLEAISKISKTVVSNRYLKEILQLIVTITTQVMDLKLSSILLLDEKKKELTISATLSSNQEYIEKPNLKIDDSISGMVVREKRPITVVDVTKEKNYRYPEIAKKEGVVSMLSVPMMVKDKVIGVINVYTEKEHIFTKEEVELLQVIADQAAVAIENTRLNEEVFAAKEALETRKIVEKAKGILMKELNISEDEAYKKIHRKSMDLRKSMKEVAEAIILTFEMRENTKKLK